MILPFPVEYIAFAGTLAIIFILAFWILALEKRLKRLTVGKKASSLEDTIHILASDVELIKKHARALEKNNESIEDKLSSTIRGVATVRFNPFKGSGSNQSFTTAFLDEHGTGVVISALYSRERVSVFAKPIEELASTYKLMDEERQAISLAQNRLK